MLNLMLPKGRIAQKAWQKDKVLRTGHLRNNSAKVVENADFSGFSGVDTRKLTPIMPRREPVATAARPMADVMQLNIPRDGDIPTQWNLQTSAFRRTL
jgi:hypothetical protein